jgi:type III pantothenate kinase
MASLVVDIGNSRIKSALFVDEHQKAEHSCDTLDEAIAFWNGLVFEKCLISSVKISKSELQSRLTFPFLFLDQDTPTPLKNAYSTPHTLGLDRLAGAVGAWKMAGKKPVLAIDLGSCITYELVDDQDTYLGGSITPGMIMRAKAMHHFTARLPEISLYPKPDQDWGDSTISCMRSGIWSGVKFEMEGFIKNYRLKFPEISAYICGGDSQSFESLAKDHIFVVPNLVLYGLNCILNHNVE